MKLTNKYNLPDPIVKAVEHKWYSGDPNSFSVTRLLKNSQQVHLERQHWGEIEEDVSDRLWAIYGQAVHSILEKSKSENSLSEERMKVQIGDTWITGQIDQYCGNKEKLSDYKFVGVFAYIYGKERVEEFTKQLNCYAFLLREYGFNVRELEIVFMFRDWSKLKARTQHGYPPSPQITLKIELWDHEKARQFIMDRIEYHKEPHECTTEEKWERPEKLALMKEGGKRAKKLYDTEEDAILGLKESCESDKKGKYYIDHRPGEPVKCLEYCNVSSFCPQFKKMKINKEENGDFI